MTSNTQNNKPPVLKEWAYEKVKDDILNQRIEAGSALKIIHLATELEISRTPVREALLMLEQEGLIRTIPRVGYFVADINCSETVDLLEIRAVLEGWGVGLVCAVFSTDDCNALEKMIEKCEKAIGKVSPKVFVEHDIAFHNFLIERVPNSYLVKLIEPMDDLMYRERFLVATHFTNMTASLAEHRAILNALIEKNEKKVSDLVHQHWCAARERLLRTLKDTYS